MSKLNMPKKQEYATKLTLIGIFLSLFAAFVSRLSVWRKEKEYTLRPFDLLLLVFATLRMGRMISYDRVAEPIREPFTRTIPDPTGIGESVEPKGEGLTRSMGQLLSCPICVGTWIAAGLVYGLQTLPNPTRVFLAIMSTMGITEVLNELTEALQWIAQLARSLAGNQEELKQARVLEPINSLFNPGGYYVGNDHEKYYRQSGR